MADDPKPEPDPKPDPAPAPDPDAGAKKALDAERTARREAERQLKEMQAQLQELTDKDKSEVERLREQVTAVTKERDELSSSSMRSDIAIAKGLTAAQAKRLVGATREELEADADEIIEAFPAGGVKPPPSQKPNPDLKGGTDPTDDAVDVKSIVDSIPSTY